MDQQVPILMVYQLLLVIAGLVIASLGSRFLMSQVQRTGCVIAAAAGVWGAWDGVDQWFNAVHPFEAKWLGLAQVFACVIGGVVIFVITWAITARNQEVTPSPVAAS